MVTTTAGVDTSKTCTVLVSALHASSTLSHFLRQDWYLLLGPAPPLAVLSAQGRSQPSIDRILMPTYDRGLRASGTRRKILCRVPWLDKMELTISLLIQGIIQQIFKVLMMKYSQTTMHKPLAYCSFLHKSPPPLCFVFRPHTTVSRIQQ